MKKIKSQKDKEQRFLMNEDSPEYWDVHDASDILETGEKIKLEIARPDFHCKACGSSRLRKRIIDIPILNNTVLLKRIKTLFCADCETSIIEDESLNELRDKLKRISLQLDIKTFTDFVKEGLAEYETKWAEKEKERKVISIYLPTKKRVPAKAQISLLISDPLYPKLRLLTSELIREMLGLQYFEDLELKAKEQNRSISQYLKLELSRKILGDSSSLDVKETNESKHSAKSFQIFTIIPRKVDLDFLRKTQRESLSLAAKSAKDKEIILLETPDRKFEGILRFDFEKADLYIEIIKDAIGLNVFDFDLLMNDSIIESRKDQKVLDNRIVLRSKNKDISEKISKIILKQIQ